MSGRPILSWLILLGGVACAKPAEPPAAAPAVDSAAVTAAVASLWQRYGQAVLAGDTTTMLALFSDSLRVDARGLPPMVGKAAVQAQFSPMWKTTRYTTFTVTPDLTIPVSNELAYQNGSFVEGSTTRGKGMTEYGRYASAIMKGPDGQWRLGYIMAFPDSTVPAKK
jgi:ketosteroid isomerase-like protein